MYSTSGTALSLLQSKVKRFALCWRIDRTDGVTIRLTDHNAPLMCGDGAYGPMGVASGTAQQRMLGMNERNIEVKGAIVSDLITESDLMAGKYRDAKITEMCVDWSVPTVVFYSNVYWLNTLQFNEEFWDGNLTGLTTWLKKPIGRNYNRLCDANLGDNRCKFDLDELQETGDVTVIDDYRRSFQFGSGFSAGYWDRGQVDWISGANAGTSSEISKWDGTLLTLYLETPFAMAVGDQFNIVPGCDKKFSTCQAKFNNHKNFRGFPTVPGNDTLTYFRNAGNST